MVKRCLAWLAALAILASLCPFALADDAADTPAPPQPTSSADEASVTYADIAYGSTGTAVTLLQRRLAQLGFFSGTVDGEFGQQTKQAIKDFQTYLQAVEALEIANYIEAMTPTLAPVTPEPAPTPDENGVTPKPTKTPKATKEVSPTPALDELPSGDVKVTGDATADVLEMLYNDELDLYIGDVEPDAYSLEGQRAQNRLVYLNYLNATVDGVFGTNSLAAMRAFQKDNGLEPTGVPDAATRPLLYAEDATRATKPIYNQLVEGYESTQVEQVQIQLYTLGFMMAKPSSKFGSNTRRAVKAVQNYLYHYGLMYADEAVATAVVPVATATPAPVDDMTESTGEFGDRADGDTVMVEDGVTYVYTPSGKADPDLQELLLDEGIQIYRETLTRENTSQTAEEVLRLQRRLYVLGFIYGSGSVDGVFGDLTLQGVQWFQERNGLSVTGVADEETQLLLFSESALPILKPYYIEVNLDEQRVYVYAPDEYENYTVLVKKMKCSSGKNETPTPKGTFYYTSPGARWHHFSEFGSWAQYAFYIEGNIMFHSVLYNEKDKESSIQSGTVSALGKKASHGCVRLAVEDAKWIWDNCPKRTVVWIH